MRVLILGGTGFIGPQIALRLVEYDHEVVVFHRGSLGTHLPDGVAVIHGDRNALQRSVDDFRRFRPDVVVDVIAFTEKQAAAFLDTFRGITKRAVVLSSGDVYRANDILFARARGEIEPTPLVESSPLRERLYPYRGLSIPYAYGINWDEYDKILVERLVLGNRDLPVTVLRLPMVFGPGARDAAQRRFFPYLKRMDDGRPAILLDVRTARWRGPWGYSADVGEAVRLIVERDQATGETYNVGDPSGLGLESWIRELADVAGWAGKIVAVDETCPPPNFPRTLNLNQNLDMDTSKIRRELGYHETVSRREALETTVSWDREHPLGSFDSAHFDYAAEDTILKRAG